HPPSSRSSTLSLHDALPISIAKESGPAARTGDSVQVTKVELESDRIVLEINGGFKGGRKWYSGVQVSANGNAPVPISNNDSNARSEEHTSELQSQSNLVCRL